MNSVEKPRRSVAIWLLAGSWLTAAVILAILAMTWKPDSASALPEATERLRAQGAPQFSCSPRTLIRGKDNSLTITAKGERPAASGHDGAVFLRIPALGVNKETSLKALYDGVTLSLRPQEDANTRLEIKAPQFTASIPLAVASERVLGDGGRIWTLATKDAVLRANGRFEVPIYLQLQVMQNNELVPVKAEADYVFVVKELSDNKVLGRLTLSRENAISDYIWLPLDPERDIELIATSEDSRLETNPFPISWQRYGPQLSIAVVPSHPTAFATYSTRVNVGAYLAYQNRLVPPPYATQVFVQGPPEISLSPASPLKLDPKTNISTTDIVSTTFGRTIATLTFTEPRSGTSTEVQVLFDFPSLYYGIALVSGVLGALFAIRPPFSTMSSSKKIVSAVAGGVTGLLLYVLILAGWSGASSSVVVLVGPTPAFLVGFGGGVAGDAVVTLVGKMFLPQPT